MLLRSLKFWTAVPLCAAAIFSRSVQAEPPPPTLAAETLRDHIAALAPGVRPDEAQRVAISAYAAADQLRREYRVVGPPLFHNFLVNTGIRKRGLCFQWAEDLLARLDSLRLSSVELHWGEARAGTLREHNCVLSQPRVSSFALALCSIAGVIRAISSGRPSRPIIILGWKTGLTRN